MTVIAVVGGIVFGVAVIALAFFDMFRMWRDRPVVVRESDGVWRPARGRWSRR